MCLYFMHTLALQDGPTENDTRECNTLCLSYILYIMLQKAFELGFTLGGGGGGLPYGTDRDAHWKF